MFHKNQPAKVISFFSLLALLLSTLACTGGQLLAPTATATATATATTTATATATLVPPTSTPIPPTVTLTPIPPTSTPILPTPDIAFRRITLNQLKPSLIFDFPIELDIPKEYVSVNNDFTEYDQYIWMPKKYASSYQGFVPADVDFLNVKTSLDVGYDATTNTFIGMPYTDQEKKDFENALGGTITLLEQSKIGVFPIMIVEVSNLPADKYNGFTKLNVLYLGTTVGTMTIAISTLSSPENFIRNEFIWERLKTSLSIRK
jgi:hypothetical protein